jgi:hypothetical protein
MALRQEFTANVIALDKNLHDMERRLLSKIDTTHQPGGCPPVQDHEKRLRDLEELVTTMKAQLDTTNKLLGFVTGAVVVSVIGLLWSLITGQAVINFLP